MNFLTLWNGLTADVVADGAVIWCVNVLLQTTLVAVMALVVSTWFRQSPAVRYGVLCCGLILTLICPLSVWCMQSAGVGLLTVSLHSAAQPPATISEASPLTTAEPRSNPIANPPSSPSRSTSAAAMFPPDDPTHQSSQFDFSNGEQLGSTIDAIQPEPHPTKAISNNPFEPDSTEAPKLATSSAPPSAVSYMARAIIPSVLIVWLSLATLLLVRLVVGWMRVLRWLRSSERTTNERLLAAYRHACGALNISERIADLRTSSQLDGPIAAGWLHPIVVLPQRLIAQITDKQLHDILVHELAHIIRHDQIVVLLQNTAQAIFWLHPLVRRLNRQLAQAREEVCDNYVLSTSDAPTYSRTLLAIAEIVSPRRPLPGTVGLFTSRWRLEHRIAGLLDARRSRMTKLTSRSIALVTLMTITLIGLSWLATLSLAVAEPQDRPEVSSDSAQELPTETTNLKRLEPETLDFISDRTTVAGRVLDQAGNPIEDARIIIGLPFSQTEFRGLGTVAPIETKSAKDGTFAISYLLSELLQVTEPISAGAWKQIRHEVYVASIANDLGADWYPTIDIAKDQSILLTLRPSRTLAGRLLDIEGNPVPKANLRLQSLASAADGNIEPWLASLRDGKEIGQATGEHQLRSLSAEFLDRPCEYTTDNSGRFEIPDIGQDQVATLAVTAPGIARQVIRMIAREVEPMSTNSQQNHLESPTLYGQQSNAIVVAPSQAIEGVVRDATTKEPLANVAVESSRVAGSNITGNRSNLIRVASDENGRYRLEGLPKGEGNVLLAVPNDDQPYFMRELAVPVVDGMQPVKLDIELSRGVWLEGKVVDRDTQAPVSSKLIYLPFLDNPAANAALGFNTIGGGFVDACFSYQERYQTRRDGSFRIVVLPGRAIVGAQTYGGPSDSYQKGIGSQHIRGMKEDGTFATYRNPFAASNKSPDVMAEIDVPEDGKVPPIVLEAVAGVPIKIRVVDSNGKPVTGFNVSGKSFSSQWDRKLDNSEFEVTGLGPQDSRTILVLQEELRIGRAFRITPALDRSRVIDIALAPLSTVRGRIIDKDDAPIAHARISALTQPLEDYNPRLDGITTDNFGNFHLVNVPAGTAYRIEARTRDRSMHHLQKIEFEAQAGQTIDVGTYRADGEGKLVSISDEPKQSSQTKTPASASKLSIDSEERDNADALSGSNVSGVIKDVDGKLVANAMVAVVAFGIHPETLESSSCQIPPHRH